MLYKLSPIAEGLSPFTNRRYLWVMNGRFSKTQMMRASAFIINAEDGIQADYLDLDISISANGFFNGSGYVPEKDYPTVSYRFLSTV